MLHSFHQIFTSEFYKLPENTENIKNFHTSEWVYSTSKKCGHIKPPTKESDRVT